MGKYVLDSEWGTKYPNFKKSEFKCPCGRCDGYGNGIASSLLVTLQKLRDKYGKLQITSGYRCESYNKKVGGSTNSKHMKGQAADFYIDGFNSQSKRVDMVNELKQTEYYNYSYCNVNGNYPNMGNVVHIDTKLVDTDAKEETTTAEYKFKVGDKVIINGSLYVSSNADSPAGKVSNKVTTITRLAEGTKHPYNTTGDLGWMDEKDIRLYEESERVTYTVQKGDNLTKIAKKYNTTWKKIYEDNKDIIGDDPNLIKVGQVLTIS